MPINFGTDGWRAVISDTFTFHNLRMVTQAIADAVASGSWINGTVKDRHVDLQRMVVGFDTRFLSDRFAAEVARVLAANGFTVHLAQADAPTPAISYSVTSSQRDWRRDDHGLAQCPALQRGKVEISLRWFSPA